MAGGSMQNERVGEPTLAERSISVVVLAAGRGRRMGEGPAKLLVPLADGEPLVRHAVHGALDLKPLEVIVVTRPDDAGSAVAQALAGLPVRCVTNPRHDEGMGTSLALGVLALSPQVGAVLVLLGDMPAVPRRIVEALVAAYEREGKPVTIPRYGAEVGPPTLFARPLFAELARLEGDQGGRQIVKRYPHLAQIVPFPEEERPPDIDTPRDLEKLFGGRP